ncbi:chloride channel [Lipomyces oligophaga]|uniref:chloride channel n=1 Tax=Lipomyces oligophaga TaxID=45792 RepID=UPI0034CE5C72
MASANKYASVPGEEVEDDLATPNSSRSGSINLELNSQANFPRTGTTLNESDLVSNPWPNSSVEMEGSSTLENSQKSLGLGEHAERSYDFASQDRLNPSSAAIGDMGATTWHTEPGMPFIPVSRFSVESASTVKGISNWGIDGANTVAYENLSTIDWVNEYRRERTFRGKIKTYIPESAQLWFILIATGLVVGALTSGIDIIVNWLADVKLGYCHSQFYLSQEICCLGEDDMDCSNWTTWSEAFHLPLAGGYIIDLIFYILYALIFGATAAFLVQEYAPYASHSGIPEIKTILGGFIIKGFMGFWTLIIKTLSTCLAAASGLWFGGEEPLVHIACCCANLLTRLSPIITRNEARKRGIYSAAAAAGIAVAFGAPVGGVLFSLEQMSYYFPDKTLWESFVCAMTASVTLQLINPFRSGKLVIFQVPSTKTFERFEIFPFILLGVFGGVMGACFIKVNMAIAYWRSRSRIFDYPLAEVAGLSILTAFVNFFNPFSRLQNLELVADLFKECGNSSPSSTFLCSPDSETRNILLLLLACLTGFIFSAITFGTMIPSGIMMPSMTVGACAGRALGILIESWQQHYPKSIVFRTCPIEGSCINPAVYAIVGGAAALGGVTRLTVSLVVIMFELTGALGYVLPIMISLMVAKWVGDAIDHNGIYERWIQFRGYPYLSNNVGVPIPDVTVDEIMTPAAQLTVLTSTGHTIGHLEELLRSNEYKGFPIVQDRDSYALVGYITRSELKFALQQAKTMPRFSVWTPCLFSGVVPSGAGAFVDFRQVVDNTPWNISYRSTLLLATTMFQQMGLRYLLLTKKGRLEGMLMKKDICAVQISD